MKWSDEWYFETQTVGRRVLVYDRVDSTSTQAFALADGGGGHHGVTLLAREQTAGRGQYGRVWRASRDSSVLLSVLLFPAAELRRPVLLTAWAAVSVCRLIFDVSGLASRIKWPNDVLIDGKKVCGILTEQQQRKSLSATVTGIGLNVNQTVAEFWEAELPGATSLAAASQRRFDWGQIATGLIRSLDEHFVKLSDGRSEELEREWRTRLGLVDRAVEVRSIHGPVRGRVREIGFEEVAVETFEGECVRLRPEAVRHIVEMD